MKIRNDTDREVTYTVTVFEPGTVVYQRYQDESAETVQRIHPAGFLTCEEFADADNPVVLEWRWYPDLDAAVAALDDTDVDFGVAGKLALLWRHDEKAGNEPTVVGYDNYQIRRTPEGLPKWWAEEVH